VLKPQHRPAHPEIEAPAQEADEGDAAPLPFELDGIAERDIAETGWAVLEALTRGEIDQRAVGVVASVLRVLLTAGSSSIANEDALREVELRGLLMHGIPPRNDAEWSLMRATFSPEAVAEARRWRPLAEGDALDGVDAGVFREPFAGEEGESLVIEGDDE
jgi:hypothetical protein